MSKIISTASIAENLDNYVFSNFDFEKSVAKYEEDKSNYLFMGSLKEGKRNTKVSLTGELAADQLLVSEFDNGKNFTLVLTLDETDDLDAFEKIQEKLVSNIPENEDYTITCPVKDEKVYLKLKPSKDKKSFIAKNNLKLNPNKLENSGLYRGQRVDIIGEIGYYVNLKDSKAGLMFTPMKITFELDIEEPPVKKQKK